MTVAVVVTADPLCARGTTPAQDVARDLSDRMVSSALVVDAQGRLIGIFADAMRVLGRGCQNPSGALTHAHDVTTF